MIYFQSSSSLAAAPAETRVSCFGKRRREGGKGEIRASMRGCWKRGGGEGIVGRRAAGSQCMMKYRAYGRRVREKKRVESNKDRLFLFYHHFMRTT